jgi:hypothetical protein
MWRNALRMLGWAAGIAWLLGPQAALAVEVFLNGTKITGLGDQVIEKATVTLDKAGNVHISAPEYKVRELGAESAAPAPQPAAPRLQRKYFVIADVSQPHATAYSVQLIVNNRFVRTFDDSIPQSIIELNEHLQAGANTVSFRGLRPEGKRAQGQGPEALLTILVGAGKTEGGQLIIEDVIGELKIAASSQGEVTKSFDLSAK